MTEQRPIEVIATATFKTQLRKLSKRYRSLRSDLQPLLEQLQAGTFPGDQIPGTSYTVFKVRLKNSDIQKGKSAGYRVIYQVRGNICILLYGGPQKLDRWLSSKTGARHPLKKEKEY